MSARLPAQRVIVHIECHVGSGATARSNKELKLTKPDTIGASQLNSSVLRT
jgi:hypothetical protein